MDLRRDNPVNRVPDFSRTRRASASFTEDGWLLGRRSGGWATHSIGEMLPILDRYHELSVLGSVPAGHGSVVASFLESAIARGTFVTQDPSDSLTGLSDLRSVLPRTDPSIRAGDLAWDSAAVEQRRTVLSASLRSWPSLSAVLVSKRSDLIAPMVRTLAAMDYPDLEIVVGLHGADAPSRLEEASAPRPVVVRTFPEHMVFGEVLHETFTMASGEVVTKIDDDDHYGDQHLRDLVLAHAYSGATLVGKATTMVHLEALNATVRRVFGRWETFTHRVAGGTMLLSAEDLDELGGWPHVPRGVDTALLASVADAGGSTYYPHDIGYLYVRDSDGDHTWSTDVSHFLRNTRQQWVGLYRGAEFGTA